MIVLAMNISDLRHPSYLYPHGSTVYTPMSRYQEVNSIESAWIFFPLFFA